MAPCITFSAFGTDMSESVSRVSEMVKGVFFDMDGVVVDSAPLWSYVTGAIKSEYGLDMSVLEKNDGFNLSVREAMCRILEAMGRFSVSLLKEIMARTDSLYASGIGMVTLMPDIREALDMLRKRGVATALVSNSSRFQVEMVLKHLGLGNCFSTVVTADDVKHGKPDPEPYLLAVKLSGLSVGNAVAVEDSPTGVAAALKSGMRCLVVSCNEQVFPDPADCQAAVCVYREKLYEKLDKITGLNA